MNSEGLNLTAVCTFCFRTRTWDQAPHSKVADVVFTAIAYGRLVSSHLGFLPNLGVCVDGDLEQGTPDQETTLILPLITTDMVFTGVVIAC